MAEFVRFVRILAIIVAVLLYAALFTYNVFNYSKFFETPIYNLLNIAVAVVVAYYFVQKKNDERKLKEIVEDVIGKIQGIIETEAIYSFDGNSDKKRVLQTIRNLSNKISILTGLKEKLNMNKDVQGIEENFKVYKETVSDYIEDLDKLSSKEIELRRLTNVINNHCDALRIKLYQ